MWSTATMKVEIPWELADWDIVEAIEKMQGEPGIAGHVAMRWYAEELSKLATIRQGPRHERK